MPFRLCNAPATFQRCMMAIFKDMAEDITEVFMDDFSVFGDSFELCLKNLERVLGQCEETNLVLSWGKCHFMVNEGIVLGRKISHKRIKVDKAKVATIEKLTPPILVKTIIILLVYTSFYRRFVHNFSWSSDHWWSYLKKILLLSLMMITWLPFSPSRKSSWKPRL